MKTIHGNPANETHVTPKAERDRLTFQFVTDDNNTASSFTVRIGDTDPVTGEKITNLDFFHEFYKHIDSEIYSNLKTMRPDYTGSQKAWRREEARKYSEEFREEHGYAPTRDDIRWHLEQQEKRRYNLYYDSLTGEDGDSLTDCMADFGARDACPFGTDLPDDVYRLRELADTFTDRQRDVFEAMLTNISGGKTKITNTALARRWGVCEKMIRKEQAAIIGMIKKYFGK